MIFCSKAQSEIMVAGNGAPVWPLADASDRQAVVGAARNFGCAIRWVKGEPAEARSGRGVVLAYGAEAAEVAALYAHLTGRRLRIARDRAALARAGRCKVIVALMQRIDDDLFESIYAARACPGLIVGVTLGDLRRRVLVCAVAATSRPDRLPHRVELFPAFDFATARGRTNTIIGRRSSRTDIRTTLARGGSAIMIHGHGDGVDGDFGALVLCPVDKLWRASAVEHAPVCKMTGMCYRRQIAISTRAHAAGRLHPKEISARVLVWNTCLGFPSPHAFIHPRWGVGSRLAASDSVGAFITTWRIAIAPPALGATLVDRMMTGATLGEAVGRYNASVGSRRWGNKLCLFGDPDTRIAPTTMSKGHGVRAVTAGKRRSGVGDSDPSGEPAAIAFIAVCLASEVGDRAITRDGERELGLRDRARAALAGARAGGARHELHTAFAAYATHRAGVRDLWLPAAKSIEAVGECRCPHCGGYALRYRTRLANAAPRTTIICNRCEVVADLPEALAVSARIAHDEIEISGSDLDTPAWTGAVKAGSRWPIAPREWLWPADAAGHAARFMQFGTVAWQHPSEVSVIIMLGLDVCVFSRTLRALPLPPR